jgi:hypothetical protein
MNNIHEKDWAEDSWGGYSGMGNDSDWCNVNKKVDDKPVTKTDDNECPTEENNGSMTKR